MLATNLFSIQTFAPKDVFILFILFMVEIFLSADNILAISLILDKIEEKKRRLCLLFGVWSSLIFRAAIIAFTAFLFLIDFLKIIGGLYLIYLAINHNFHQKNKKIGDLKKISLLRGIISIEFTDIVFALDSIFIALALLSFFYTEVEVSSKLWVAYLGGFFGVFTLRFLAPHLLVFLNKHPKIEKIAYVLIGWIGVKLIFIGFNLPHYIPYFNTIFVVGIIFIAAYFFLSTKWPFKR